MTNTFSAFNLKNFLQLLGKSSSGHNELSLIKELIDNSLDANSRNITFEINNKDGNFIELTDDGDGMTQQDLFRCIQFYSQNENNKIGKFGIGGSTSLVYLSDINNESRNKTLSIITKNNNTVISIHIDWNICNSISDLEKQVNLSLKVNDENDIDIMKSLKSGTKFKIGTSKEMIEMMKENVCCDLISFLDIGLTYNDYFDKGINLELFNNEQIKSFKLINPLISDIIPIEIYSKGKKIAYRSKIGRKSYEQISNTTNRKLLNCSTSVIGSLPFKCSINIRLSFPKDIYKPKSWELDKWTDNRTAYNIDNNNFREMIDYCKDIGDLDSFEDKEDINYMINLFLNPLHVVRKDNGTGRRLGTLDINSETLDCNKDRWLHKSIKYIHKELIITPENDSNLNLIQENKSVIEWTNAPKWLKEHIEYIEKIWVKDILSKKFDKIDKEYLKPFVDASNTIKTRWKEYNLNKIIQKEYIKKKQATLKIQSCFRNLKPFNISLKFRKFIIWSIKHINDKKTRAAIKIQRAYKKYKLNKNQKDNNIHNIIHNISATKIQSIYRGYKTRKIIKYEKEKQQHFKKDYIDNFQSLIINKLKKITKVNDLYEFEKEINEKISLLKKKYPQNNFIS